MVNNVLKHHGILGQKWGVKNGPPYPLSGGDYSKSEIVEIYNKRKRNKNSIYNKKHFDTVLDKNKTVLSTLSYDKDRLDKSDMFYAAHEKLDKHQYNALFNKKVDVDGVMRMKYRIDTGLNTDLKVASEDTSAKTFIDLYNNDRNFYNFVTDKNRMRKYFVDEKYKFKGYREARDVLDKMDDPDYVPSDQELKTVYRLFNYVIPYDGGGSDDRGKNDVAANRNKFFKELKKQGYGACLDTNDALYGAFKATDPVIVFDKESLIPKGVYQTNMKDKRFSNLVFAGRKLLGI